MMQSLEKLLSYVERTAVSPVFDIPQEALDPRSELLPGEEFLVCRFVAVGDRCCPFELHFGRGSSINRINFFVGLGAEFYNYEELNDLAAAAETATDIRQFLLSEVRVAQTVAANGEVLAADYFPSLLAIDGSALRLRYAGKASLLRRSTGRMTSYAPWLPHKATGMDG